MVTTSRIELITVMMPTLDISAELLQRRVAYDLNAAVGHRHDKARCARAMLSFSRLQ